MAKFLITSEECTGPPLLTALRLILGLPIATIRGIYVTFFVSLLLIDTQQSILLADVSSTVKWGTKLSFDRVIE